MFFKLIAGAAITLALGLPMQAVAGATGKGGQPPTSETGQPPAANAGPDISSLPDCEIPGEGVASVDCKCAPDFAQGSVWGSGPYTADSNICTAAQHSGVIDASGGGLRLVPRPGLGDYPGTSQNGITTSSWGSYDNSFDVYTLGATIPPFTPALAQCGTLADGTDRLNCSCSASSFSGSVWGSGPYTADSDICTAARHAGLISEDNVEVTVQRLDGLSFYRGSTANGVSSSEWAAYTSSITFDRN